MTRSIVPHDRPRLPDAVVRATVERLIRADPACRPEAILTACPVRLLGVRGYFRRTMGDPTKNDRGIFDDAIFVVSPEGVGRFNGNTDPSRYGVNAELGKPYALLRPGVWPYRQGPHRGRPGHFRQPDDEDAERLQLDRFFTDDRALGEFCVMRDAARDWGHFAINIHPGSTRGTSSAGCQTIYPEQWLEFRDQAYAALLAHDQTWHAGRWVVYVLTDEKLA